MKKRIYIDCQDVVKNGEVYCVYVARIQRRLLGFIWIDICVIADTDIEYVENRSAEILGYLEDEIEIKERADGEDRTDTEATGVADQALQAYDE